MPALEPVLGRIEEDFDAAVGRLVELLRIPSVSTDPAFKAETRRAGQYLADQLAGLGFQVELRDTPGHPVLVAHHPGPGGDAPHVLYYGHYDVQPPDPLELWHSPPFEPAIVEAERGPRVVARGAVDDKGQVMTWIEAFRAWHAVHGSLPIRITVLVEGEEETGSPSLPPFLQQYREELSAPDFCLVTDTNSWDIDTPAITTMLRGLMAFEVTLHGPSRDLHSGLYGGAVPNPINVLTRILGQIHDADNRIQFPGFYDSVVEPTEAERAQWRSLGFDEAGFLGEVGVSAGYGEAGRSILERLWTRPTCDINGIWGGYTGAGNKTVIAAHASAKLTCRLVGDQDPEAVAAGIRRFFEDRVPPGCRIEISGLDGAAAVRVPTESPWVQAASDGLRRIYGRDPVSMGMGGSIPVVRWIKDTLGLDCVLVGFGLNDDRIHSPNEKFELRCLKNGIRSHAAILARLADGAV
ncbi:MAG TPA: dipeptidase [Alphaproteobacteria bacterium]|nr:dipeptidase [Alphaproteobacteria bacterium]